MANTVESRWDIGLWDVALWDSDTYTYTTVLAVKRFEQTTAGPFRRTDNGRFEQTTPGVFRRIDQ